MAKESGKGMNQLTVTAVAEFTIDPLPSAPKSPSPQHCTVVSLSWAHVWKPPAVMATALVIPATRTGVSEPVVVPSPSCPKPLLPQHCTVPSRMSAQV